MTLSLQQYRRTHQAQGDVLRALREHVRSFGVPDAAGIERLSRKWDMPPASLRAALSYYDDLPHPPAMRVCEGTSCALAGAEGLRSALDRGQQPARAVYCLGYCDQSPVALGPDDSVWTRCAPRGLSAPTDAPNDNAGPAPGIQAQPPSMPSIRCAASRPVVTERLLLGDHAPFAKSRQAGVYEALKKARSLPPSQVIEIIKRSGERGRGGAAFPTAAKWQLAAETAADTRYVIANGDEGDPGSFIDRVLMEQDPHALLEGLAIAAHAVGAERGIVFIRGEYPRAIARVGRAIEEASAAGLLGGTRMDGGRPFAVEVFVGMGSYVCGEETALINAIEGFRGEVRLRPPYPAERGLWGKPTVVNNVETLVNVPWIVRHGGEAYAALGTKTCAGTKAMCFNHGFAKPGIVEVEFGMSLRDAIEREAGGAAGPKPIEAVVLGGPMGSLLTRDEWDVPIDSVAMAWRGIQLGHGGVVALPEGTDYAALLRHWARFMRHESCGKCVPCRVGSQRLVELVGQAPSHDGRVPAERQESLESLLDLVSATSLCAFGQSMPGPMKTMLRKFGDRVFDGYVNR